MFKPYSEKTAELIDLKVKELINAAYQKSKAILLDSKELMEKMAKVLSEKEYLTREEFESFMKEPHDAEIFMKKLLDEYHEELKKVETSNA